MDDDTEQRLTAATAARRQAEAALARAVEHETQCRAEAFAPPWWVNRRWWTPRPGSG
jgi:hypothetical protein